MNPAFIYNTKYKFDIYTCTLVAIYITLYVIINCNLQNPTVTVTTFSLNYNKGSEVSYILCYNNCKLHNTAF